MQIEFKLMLFLVGYHHARGRGGWRERSDLPAKRKKKGKNKKKRLRDHLFVSRTNTNKYKGKRAAAVAAAAAGQLRFFLSPVEYSSIDQPEPSAESSKEGGNGWCKGSAVG